MGGEGGKRGGGGAKQQKESKQGCREVGCLTNKAEAFTSSFSVADLACQISVILR